MERMTATDASRNFSDLLDRVAAGEEIEIVRGGMAVAVIGPPKRHLISAERFHELMESAPPVDAAFADDVAAAKRELGTPEDPWAS